MKKAIETLKCISAMLGAIILIINQISELSEATQKLVVIFNPESDEDENGNEE